MGFWDHPKNGLGEYQGKKVWFQIEDDGTILKEVDYTQEIKDIIKNYKFDEDDGDQIDSTDDYYIEHYPEWFTPSIDGVKQFMPAYFRVCHKLTYKMYKLPEDVLKDIEEYEKLLEKYRIYNSWHDPAKFKPYDSTVARQQEYYDDINSKPGLRVKADDLVNYECVGTVKEDEIEWFSRPWNWTKN